MAESKTLAFLRIAMADLRERGGTITFTAAQLQNLLKGIELEHVCCPTLLRIGLGDQLEALERICAESLAGKHAGETILDPGADHHFTKADSHMVRAGFEYGERDADSGERHLIHAAARLLMAAACVDAEDEHG